MEPDRRQIVCGAGWAFCALSFPKLFGDGRDAVTPELRTRLVFRVHEITRLSADLGHLLGTFLLHGSDEDVALLAACDVVLAVGREFHEIAPDLASDPAVRAILISPGEDPVVAVLGAPPPRPLASVMVPDDGDRTHELDVERRHAWLAQQMRRVLEPNAAALERRAARERTARGAPPRDATPVDLARGWPCWIRLRAEMEPKSRARWLQTLALVTRERWVADPPRGSTWEVSTGCGGGPCGMAHTPAISRRFLQFYTAQERQP